jgi:hypothetical protein
VGQYTGPLEECKKKFQPVREILNDARIEKANAACRQSARTFCKSKSHLRHTRAEPNSPRHAWGFFKLIPDSLAIYKSIASEKML